MSQDDISLRPISLDEFNAIQGQIVEDHTQNNFVDFRFYSEGLMGIYSENILVGLIRLGEYAGNIAPDIYILKDYRGKNIAEYALNQSLALGINFPDSRYFWLTISPNNQKALRMVEKLGWKRTHEFDEAMLEEGGEFFAIFETENPYYVKERSVRL